MRRMVVVGAIVGLTWGGIGALAAVAQAAPSSGASVGCTKRVGDSAGLVTAINNANQGTGPTTITLAHHCTYTLTSSPDGSNGLPVITASIVLNGSGSTITRDSGAPVFRIFEIGTTGTLTASNVIVSGGHAPDGVAGPNGSAGTNDDCNLMGSGQPGGD